MSSRLYPSPPHMDACFYFLNQETQANFARVCECVVRQGGHATGVFGVVRSKELPIFSLVSELSIEELTLPLKAASDHLVNWPAFDQGWIMRAGFEHPEMGELVVQYGLVLNPAPLQQHPVLITGSADALVRGRVVQQAWLELFRRVCDGGFVLYAGILSEADQPAPAELMSGEVSVATPLFVSARLVSSDPNLRPELDRLFNRSTSEQWGEGFFWPAPRRREMDNRAQSQAALVLGRAMARARRS